MSIEVKDLFFSYKTTFVLRKANFQVHAGELIGVMGPNGGGKTTLLKLILQFLKPDSGQIKVQGTVGYVPQIHRTDRDFPISVEELVLLGALSRTNFWGAYPKVVKERCRELLETLGLMDHRKKAFGTLSGGLAQRALLARSLLSDPDLLLLDEPTANIDPHSRQIIFSLLENLKRKKTILLVTHDLKTIVEKVDRFLCVQGEISSFYPAEVCEHFALGLYHTPLMGLPSNHFGYKSSLCPSC